MRLGCGGPLEQSVCGSCGHVLLDCAGGHASCCAPGEATRKHHAVRDVIFEFSKTADDATEREPQDLVPSRPGLRPADVLSSAAIPGRVAALDVGVASPFSPSAGTDAAAHMFARKTGEREAIAGDLAKLNIVYRPVVFTTFGRPHAAASETLRYMARRVARRRGGASRKAILSQMEGAISVALARGAARMSLACWPAAAKAPPDLARLADAFAADVGD